MESLDRPERRELIKTGREASAPDGRLEVATLCAKAIAEVRACVRTKEGGGRGRKSSSLFIAHFGGCSCLRGSVHPSVQVEGTL